MSKLNKLEEEQKGIDPAQYCIVTDIEIPKDFKMPDFDKYDGTGDPKIHVYMYTSRMGAYLKNEKLLMYYFQESLKDPAIRWYLNLDKKEIRTWKDLANAFVKHYRHNIGSALDRSSLKNLKMKKDEDFRTFALRWRNQAAQVEPPMTEKDLVDSFMEIDDLNKQYKIACATATDFTHLLNTGVRIETTIKLSAENDDLENKSNSKKDAAINQIVKFQKNSSTRSPHKVNYQANNQQLITRHQPPYQVPPQQQYQQGQVPQLQQQHQMVPIQHQHQHQRQMPPPSRKSKQHYDPLPVPQAEILKQLLAENLLTTLPARPLAPPYPAWYDPNACCAYHGNVIGHSTENCWALREKIQELIDTGRVKIGPFQSEVDNAIPDVNFVEWGMSYKSENEKGKGIKGSIKKTSKGKN